MSKKHRNRHLASIPAPPAEPAAAAPVVEGAPAPAKHKPVPLTEVNNLRPEHGFEWKAALFEFQNAAQIAQKASEHATELQAKLAAIADKFVKMYALPPETLITWGDNTFPLNRKGNAPPMPAAPSPKKAKSRDSK